MKRMLEIEITRMDVRAGRAFKLIDFVAEEKPLQIFVNKKHYATIFCSPTNLKELTLGHLLSEGILKSIEEIEVLRISADASACRVKLKPEVNIEKRQVPARLSARVIRSTCGSSSTYQYSRRIPKIRSRLAIRASTILESVSRLNSSEMFRKTGGVHVAILYDKRGEEIALAEDVGRHNAVDKVIGAGALEKIDFGDCFLALSGRLTGDIVFKAAMLQLPIVASLAAPIDSGIEIANKAGLTLVGFVRGNRMNVYAFPERIRL